VLAVNEKSPKAIVDACREIAGNPALREKLTHDALRLHQTLFNPDRLQGIFVTEIERFVAPYNHS
jgi:hypothetical protein